MNVARSNLTRPALLLAVLLAALFAMRATPAFADAPTVTGLSPDSGPVVGGTVVTITGTNFEDSEVTAVMFGANEAAEFEVVDDTTIEATAPPSTGLNQTTVDVIVEAEDGDSPDTAADDFTYDDEPGAPTITGVDPDSGPTTGGTTVTITGTNFLAPGLESFMDVDFGTTNATSFEIISDTEIEAVSPPHAEGEVRIRVTTDDFGVSPNTPADDFTYEEAPAPTITGLNPTGGPVDGGNLVVITGTGFTGVTGADGVTFGGTNATSYTVNSDVQITAIAPAHTAGTFDVVVTHPENGETANTAADNYTYGNTPTITGLAPSSGNVAGGNSVVITGTNLTGATAVTFGGTAATSFTVNSGTQITATAPAHAAGTVDVEVTTPVGETSNTAADNYTYTAGPTVTNLAPSSGPTAGGTSVVITGTGFTGATAVTFGGTNATSFTVNSSTQITAVSPAKPTGTVDVIVTGTGGSSPNTDDDNFTYGSAPTITSISPTSGPTAGGTSVTITGTGFTGATAVSFGGTAATSFTVNSDTSITAVSPAGVNGVVRISVTTPLGTTADTAADNFTYGTGSTTSFTLFFRWTLIVWNGRDGADIQSTLRGQESPDNPLTNDVSGIVTAVFHYNNAQQRFEAFFPGSAGVPGANDITTFEQGEAYWIAISQSGQVTWTVLSN